MSDLLYKIQEFKREFKNDEIRVKADISFKLVDKKLIFELYSIKAYNDYEFKYLDVKQLEKLAYPVDLLLYNNFYDDSERDTYLIDTITFSESKISHTCELSAEELNLLLSNTIRTNGIVTLNYEFGVTAYFDCDYRLNPYRKESIVYNFKCLARFYNKLFELCDRKERITYQSPSFEIDYFKLIKEDSLLFNKYFDKSLEHGRCDVNNYFIYFNDHKDVFYHGLYREGYSLKYVVCYTHENFTLDVAYHYLDRNYCQPGLYNPNFNGMFFNRISKTALESDAKKFIKNKLFKNINLEINDAYFSLTYNSGLADTIVDNKDYTYSILNSDDEIIGQIGYNDVGPDLHQYLSILAGNINNIISSVI